MYFGYSSFKAHSWENVNKKLEFGEEITSGFICYICFAALERFLFFCLLFLKVDKGFFDRIFKVGSYRNASHITNHC